MTALSQVLATIAILGNAVVYGTDVFAGLIMRSVYARVDDATLTTVAGWGHYYGDRRMPFAGAGGLIAALLTVVIAAIAGRTGAAVAAGIAVAALLIWMAIYVRIAKPVNNAQQQAAIAGATLPDVRALQHRWDSVIIIPRIGLQAVAVIALCAALAR